MPNRVGLPILFPLGKDYLHEGMGSLSPAPMLAVAVASGIRSLIAYTSRVDNRRSRSAQRRRSFGNPPNASHAQSVMRLTSAEHREHKQQEHGSHGIPAFDLHRVFQHRGLSPALGPPSGQSTSPGPHLGVEGGPAIVEGERAPVAV